MIEESKISLTEAKGAKVSIVDDFSSQRTSETELKSDK